MTDRTTGKGRPQDTPLDPDTYRKMKARQIDLLKWSEGKGKRQIAERIKEMPFEFGNLASGEPIALKFLTRLDDGGEHEYAILSPSSVSLLEAAGFADSVWQRKRDDRTDYQYTRIKVKHPYGGKGSPTPHAARVIYELHHALAVPKSQHVTTIDGNPLDLRIENLEMRRNADRKGKV